MIVPAQMFLPDQIHAAVTEEAIAAGVRGSGYANPVSLAIAAALHAANPGLDSPPLVAVFRGSSMFPNHSEETHNADAYEHNIRWHALLGWHDAPLPRRCQLFLDAWDYGPKSGPFAVRDAAGVVIARHTFREIIVPFNFCLSKG